MLRRILAIIGLFLFLGALGLLADYVFRLEPVLDEAAPARVDLPTATPGS